MTSNATRDDETWMDLWVRTIWIYGVWLVDMPRWINMRDGNGVMWFMRDDKDRVD